MGEKGEDPLLASPLYLRLRVLALAAPSLFLRVPLLAPSPSRYTCVHPKPSGAVVGTEQICCCGHSEQAHMDEGGSPAPCWECWEEKERTREATWSAGGARRWLHRVMRWHMWRFSRCLRCGV